MEESSPAKVIRLDWDLFEVATTQICRPNNRKLCSTVVAELETEKLVAHAHTLPLNGVWTKWFDEIHPFDLSWKNLLYGPGPRIVSFILNALINSLPTPDFLKIMNYRPDSACNLCQAPQCTMMHILSCCPLPCRRRGTHGDMTRS